MRYGNEPAFKLPNGRQCVLKKKVKTQLPSTHFMQNKEMVSVTRTMAVPYFE
jgi:hypothetical protein